MQLNQQVCTGTRDVDVPSHLGEELIPGGRRKLRLWAERMRHHGELDMVGPLVAGLGGVGCCILQIMKSSQRICHLPVLNVGNLKHR